jgi:hypothetical protein
MAGVSHSKAYRTLFGLDVASYVPHAVHSPQRTYPQTNCYTDVVIELLHAHGDEPLAALGFLVRSDFEGDQWTFFKPPPGDLEALYGIDVHEMQPYRPLPTQIAEQIEHGATMNIELDSYNLPDTHATAYHAAHVKSSAIPEAIDPERRYLRYFHNAGLYELEGDDYDALFAPALLPPYVELVRLDAGPRLSGEALKHAARALLGGHLAHRPKTNPFERFGEQLERELPALLAGELDEYHDYAFATVRMAGAAFELLDSHAQWLLGRTIEPLAEIVEGCKALSYRLARRKPFEVAPVIAALAAAWSRALAELCA